MLKSNYKQIARGALSRRVIASSKHRLRASSLQRLDISTLRRFACDACDGQKGCFYMNKEELLKYLDDRGVEYEKVDHNLVFTVGEMIDADLPYPEVIAKNLFVRDDKKKNFYLITVLEDKRVDLKEFRKEHETRPLSFASEELLAEKLQLTRGSVTPFGLLNNEERDVKFFIDGDFLKKGKIGIHPNLNDATVFLDAQTVIDLVKEHGNEVEVVEL